MTPRQNIGLSLFMIIGFAMIAIIIYLASQFLRDNRIAIWMTMQKIQLIVVCIFRGCVLLIVVVSAIIYIGTVRDRHNRPNNLT